MISDFNNQRRPSGLFWLTGLSLLALLLDTANHDVFAATQGSPGPTSTATSRITLIIHPPRHQITQPRALNGSPRELDSSRLARLEALCRAKLGPSQNKSTATSSSPLEPRAGDGVTTTRLQSTTSNIVEFSPPPASDYRLELRCESGPTGAQRGFSTLMITPI